jgi:nicotinamide mononucleotide transporter
MLVAFFTMFFLCGLIYTLFAGTPYYIYIHLMTVSYSTCIEVAVVVLNFLYVILMSLERRSGWIAGIAGSALFVASNLQQHLYMDMLLNSYYVLAGVYGWYIWGRQSDGQVIHITRIDKLLFIKLLGTSILLVAILGTVLYRYTDNSLPYMDAGVTVLSFLATWMAAKKYIENWIIWLVADPLAIILYATKGGWLYPVLFAAYTLMALYGYLKWKKQLAHAV